MESPENSVQACRDAQIASQQTTDSREAHSRALDELGSYFPPIRKSLVKHSEEDIYRIAGLLRLHHSAWSNVPRLYIVLRLIGRLEALPSFTSQGITDFWFPFSIRSFPLSVDQTVRQAFLEAQWTVLTKSIDLEKGEQGEHQSFAQGELFPYETKGVLGSGAFSTVDKVVSLRSGSQYARKRIRRGDSFHNAKINMESFSKELQVLKRAQHHHIVQLVGSYTDPKFVGLLFSPVADMNLAGFYSLAFKSSLDKNLLRTFFGCLSNGLSYLHGAKIRHKDIKPENILVKGKNVLLTDFNVSFDWSDAEHSITNDSMPLMTRRYGAPEMLHDGPRGSSSDIWSLGCVFLEMITILKEKTLEDMKEFFHNYDSGSVVFANNINAIKAWMVTLMKTEGLDVDNLPLGWVQGMLKKASEQRLTAEEIARKARDVERFSMRFCGPCCRVDVESARIGSGIGRDGDLVPATVTEVSGTPQSAAPSLSVNRRLAFGSLRREILSPEMLHIEAESQPTKNRVAVTPKVALFAAIRDNDGHRVSLLLEKGVSVESEDILGRRAVFKAVMSGCHDAVKTLLEKGANVNARTSGGSTALHKAVEEGLASITKLLISQGADVNIQTDFGDTALHLAVNKDKRECVQLLMEAGSNPDTQTKRGTTALHEVAFYGNADIAQMLFERNANPNIKDNRGLQPIHLAAKSGHDRIVRLLIDKGAEINVTEETLGFDPLMMASDLGHEAVARILVESGADSGYKTPSRLSALHLAAEMGHAAIVRLLVHEGWSVNALEMNGFTPLQVAAFNGHTLCLRELLDGGADVDALGREGTTPLYFAVLSNHLEAVKLLVESGADPTYKTNGLSALHLAAKKGHAMIVRLLINEGWSVNTLDKNGYTPLLDAAFNGHTQCLQELLDGGADVDALTPDGSTSLHFAALGNRLEAARFLIDNGGDTLASNSKR